jgi:hypothetical protein
MASVPKQKLKCSVASYMNLIAGVSSALAEINEGLRRNFRYRKKYLRRGSVRETR